MNLDLQNLALFLRVSELGKIARAGEEFGFSSTNTSQRIRQLESEVGASLFHRSTRVVTLTHDGEVFLEHAKRILDDVEEARIVFTGGAENVQGKLRITVSSSYGRLYIVPFIPEFIRRYPELEIEIDFNDGRVDLIEQGYDVAFRIGELQSSSLLARKLSDNPALLVASPAYLEEYGFPESPEDLKHHRCLPFGNLKEWRFRDMVGKTSEVSVKGPVSLNWGDAISDLVEAGLGVGKAYYWHAGPSLKAGRVVRVLPDYQVWPETSIWAVRPQGRLVPARLKVFLAYIEEVINRTNEERYGELLPVG